MKFKSFIYFLFLWSLIIHVSITTAHQLNRDKFTKLLSNHLLIDHYDKAYNQLSRKVSLKFRQMIHVRVKKVRPTLLDLSPPPVDINILKRQLKGAVGSFIEDKLPSILLNRHNTTSLQNKLIHLLNSYCPETPFMLNQKLVYQCLLDHRQEFLTQVVQSTSVEFETTLTQLNTIDLPRLFEKTRAQMTSILTHFNQHTMDNHQLELKMKDKKTKDSPSLNKTWITKDMIKDFILTIQHLDIQTEESTIQHFIDSSL